MFALSLSTGIADIAPSASSRVLYEFVGGLGGGGGVVSCMCKKSLLHGQRRGEMLYGHLVHSLECRDSGCCSVNRLDSLLTYVASMIIVRSV